MAAWPAETRTHFCFGGKAPSEHLRFLWRGYPEIKKRTTHSRPWPSSEMRFGSTGVTRATEGVKRFAGDPSAKARHPAFPLDNHVRMNGHKVSSHF